MILSQYEIPNFTPYKIHSLKQIISLKKTYLSLLKKQNAKNEDIKDVEDNIADLEKLLKETKRIVHLLKLNEVSQ